MLISNFSFIPLSSLFDNHMFVFYVYGLISTLYISSFVSFLKISYISDIIQWNITHHNKGWNNAFCSNLDGPRHYDAKWSEPEKDKYLSPFYKRENG